MTLEPTLDQRMQFQNLPPGPLALVQFLSIKDQTSLQQYRRNSETAVKTRRGQLRLDLKIDQILAAGELPFQAITIDRFPSQESALLSFVALSRVRQETLDQIYTPAVKPADGLPRVVKALGFLAPILSRVVGTHSEKAIPNFENVANPLTGPVPDTVAEMRKHDQHTPFYMMNLNKYYHQAKYLGEKNISADLSGEQAYNRYGNRIMPYLVSVGGYPEVIGHVTAILVGSSSCAIHDD